MKAPIQKLLLLLIFTALTLCAWADVSEYSFTSTAGSYTAISGGTVHGTSANDNENFNNIPLGFSFTYNGVVYNEVSIQANGFIAMGSAVTNTTTPISSGTGTNNVVAALSRDIKSRDNGELMSIVSGTAPNRVFTAQWSHYRRVPTPAANDDLNFQIQLHENGNKVVFVYGNITSVSVTTAATVQVGLRGASNTDFNNRTTTTNWAETVVGTANNGTCTLSATVYPSEGLTFTFAPASAGDPPLMAQNPVPANSAINTPIGASLSWVAGGGVTDGYKVYLGTDNPPTNMVNGTVQTGNIYIPNPFTYSTTYYWQIVPFNQYGDAINCPVWSFTTLADPTVVSFPYLQGFDEVTPPAQALGWTTNNANTDPYTWESVASGSQAGANAMRIRFNTALAMDDWLISPPMQLTAATSYKVKFYYRANSTTTPEKLSLYLGNAASPAALTTQLFQNTNINSTTYQLAEIVVPIAANGIYYLGFHGHSAMNMNYLYLDSFSISELNDSMNPAQNFAGNLVNADVVLTWNAPAVATRDHIGYKIYRNANLLSTINNPATLTYTDLAVPVGEYAYTLTAVYDSGESVAAGPVNISVSAQLDPPANLTASIFDYNNVHLEWDTPGTEPPVNELIEGFETYDNFTLTFAPWTLVDVDLSTTYGFSGITFTNSGAAMAYIIFNPSATTPALETPVHGGAKMAACFASTTPPNNDWLISEPITIAAGNVLKFWARSYVADYGLERFKVGISTTGTTPASFNIISGANYVSAPIEWTEYTYSLDAYVGQSVRFGIQCLSHDAFIFFVDDIYLGTPAAAPVFAHVPVNQTSVARETVANNYVAQTTQATRSLLGYKVYRNGSLVATLNNPATLEYDATALSAGQHSFTVTAYYTNGESVPAGPITLDISAPPAPPTNLTANVTGSLVTLNWVAPATRALTGYKVYRNGTLLATITDPTTTTYANANVPNGQYTYGVSATHDIGESAIVTVEANVNVTLAPAFFTETFESYDNFTLAFAPWTLLDRDLSTTYGIQNVEFPNSAAAMAYIIFNPSATTPPITSLTPHGGDKMAASFASTTPANNDWMITPRVHLGTNSAVRFWAKSHTAQYGLERFQVGVSTNANIFWQTFQFISGTNYVEAPVDWTQFTYDLSAYDGQSIYIAIRCVSNDAFVFYVDDFSIHGVGGSVSNEDPIVPVIATELKSNYPNPFNPETNIAFSMKEAGAVTLEVYNVKGQLVRTLINDVKAAGNHTVVWNGKDNNGRSVSSGIYYYKMNTGKYSSTKKMIMMK